MEIEKWADIRGYEGRYRISSFGNVKGRHNKMLKHTQRNGYETVLLFSKDGKGRRKRVNELAFEAFGIRLRPPVKPTLTVNQCKRCKTCKWRGNKIGGSSTCDFLLKTNELRGEDVSETCSRYEKEGKRKYKSKYRQHEWSMDNVWRRDEY